jgi:hypothetical protein
MRLINSTLLIALVVAFSSCKKNEACLEGPTDLRLTETATYTFCGEFKKQARWKLYDGSEVITGTGESLTHTFNTISDDAYVTVYAEGNNEKKTDSLTLNLGIKSYLLVTVKDGSGATVAGADVNFYASEDCFEDGSTDAACLLGSGSTGSDGTVELELLEPDVSYIVEVTTDEYSSNWSTDPLSDMGYDSELADFEPEGVEFTIDKDALYFLASADKWALSNVKNSAGQSIWSSVPACRKDDYLVFNRDKTWGIEEGDDVCNPAYSGAGTWVEQAFSSFPPSMTISVTNTSGSLGIDNSEIIVDDATIIHCVISPGGGGTNPQTYYFTRQ